MDVLVKIEIYRGNDRGRWRLQWCWPFWRWETTNQLMFQCWHQPPEELRYSFDDGGIVSNGLRLRGFVFEPIVSIVDQVILDVDVDGNQQPV